MTERPLILVYGNCQAEMIYATLASMGELTNRFDFAYARNYSRPDEDGPPSVPAEDLHRTAYVFEQAMAKRNFSQADAIPASAVRFGFMSLDFNPLWPLHSVDPRNHAEPDYPFGRYPYGDRAINSVVADGLRGDEGFEAYQAKSAAMLRNVDRVLDVEKRRWSLIERINDSSFLDWVLANFAKVRLFHTYNHPSHLALSMVAAVVLHKSGLVVGDVESIAEEARTHLNLFWNPDNYEAPIHPIVAETFGLEWWSPDMLYNWGGEHMSYEQLIRSQIDWRPPGEA